MFKDSRPYSGFAVDDIPAAKDFYGAKLGLDVRESHDQLEIHLPTGARILIYPKPDHVPATYTILNFPVDSVERAVDNLKQAGVTMEAYAGLTDERGIHRGDGPTIAWFKDPAGNILSVLEDD
jgi:catechol 2,3-dioxygenase-like lactoylglutathione lyase family enzyme